MNVHPAASSPSDERAIDQQLAHWVHVRTGSALLAAAVRAASRAEGHGHACASLDDPETDTRFDTDALDALRQHAWVGDGSTFAPFVLDARQRFYLWRNWQHEASLATAILQRCADRRLPIPADLLVADLAALFTGMPAGPTTWQRAAVAAVPGARLFVLTGGPGTGKTTTVVRMLLMLLRHAEACGLPAQPSIALAAPTGKAAQRLAQAIARGKAELQGLADFSALLQHIPHADARTLHRLLGYQPRDNGFGHDARHPLAADIVVVDEASMVDLAMMRQLLDALRPETVLILLGDPGQLASIDAGSVLADIVAGAPGNLMPAGLASRLTPLLPQAPGIDDDNAPLAGQVITLIHSWRAGSGLQHGIDALRDAPDPVWLDRLFDERADGDLQWRDCADQRQLQRCVDQWIADHAAMLQPLFKPGAEAAQALSQLRQGQILCALRDGPFGAQGINTLLTRRLAARFEFDPRHAWYPGRPVIVTRNDYARGLFNGDVGIALQGAQGLRVWFEVSDRDGNTGLRSYSPRALPTHETAWAITIHRSQGSEYNDVAVVLPPDADNRLLCRELVYTGVSRARNRAELWCTDDSLRAALHRPIQRQGGLRERLREGPP
ncbi:MAG TPA: exodeoxyribonuclease V subunit alpha [Rhodanobacter sp.]|nr:exodeoxyribonuclease V subunit alpha [Rhodanobacter sp.]